MTQPLSAVVLISGSGSNLQAFIEQSESGELPIQIAAVISNKADAYGLQRARSHDIPAICIAHTDFDNRTDFDHALIKAIDEYQADIVILAGFMRILTRDFVLHYTNRLINIHPSLLPKYPGVNTHAKALEANDTWHGASVHFVVPEVDAGPVIIRGRLRIQANDNAETLQNRIHKIEHIIYPLAVKWFAEKRLSIVDDDVLLDQHRSGEQMQTFDV